MQIKQLIASRVKDHFNPLHYELVNESNQHLSGQQNAQAETHFKLVVVSKSFSSLSPIQRHREVYRLLDDLLAKKVHALSLHLFSPAEWQNTVPDSPPCAHQPKDA